MSNIFFMSDTHLQHKKLLTYGTARVYDAQKRVEDGFGNYHFENVKLPFDNIENHDQAIIDNINKDVGEEDTLWMLGDVSVGGDLTDDTKDRLRSIKCKRKNLVLGNHDTPEKIKFYFEIFQKVVGAFEFKGDLILTHVPVHVQQVETRFKVNIHGHMHDEIMTKKEFVTTDWDSTLVKHIPCYKEVPDPRYVNVCMEHINMTPVPYDVIKKNLRDNGVL